MKRQPGELVLMIREVFRSKEPLAFKNREGLSDYDFALCGKSWKRGVSAMLRVKNEEHNILYCLSSILDVFDEVVLIDNGSTDATAELVRTFNARHDHGNKVLVFSYPFQIARCGGEHLATPEDSIHSLAYYYNWCLSRCRYAYVFKVDADMVVLPQSVRRMRALLRELSPFVPTVVKPPVQTTYRSPDGKWFLAKNDVHREPRLFPNTSAIHYCKGSVSEALACGIPARRSTWADVMIYELKDTSEDEFLHWTDTNFVTERKRREWENFNLVKSRAASDRDFVEISSSFLTT